MAQTFLKNANPGDMIEFHRGLYSHWAIYIGGGFVIHKWGDDDDFGESVGIVGNVATVFGAQSNKAKIMKSKICDVLKNDGTAEVNNHLDSKQKPLPVREILQRAEYAVGHEGYNLMYNNCEHFATECRYGEPCSIQVRNGIFLAAVSSFALVGALGTIAYAFSKCSQEEKSTKKKEKQVCS